MIQTGRIRKWFPDKGFGFIAPDDGGADVFCHITRMKVSDSDDVREGQSFQFVIGTNERNGKLEAQNVEALSNA